MHVVSDAVAIQLLSYQRGAISQLEEQDGIGSLDVDQLGAITRASRHFDWLCRAFQSGGARYAMNWNTGSHHPWPSQPFRIISGELLLVSNGGLDFGLMRLNEMLSTPACLMQRVPSIRITLEVIQESRLEISAGASAQEGCQWRDDS